MVSAPAQLTRPAPDRRLLGGDWTALLLLGYSMGRESCILSLAAPFVRAVRGETRPRVAELADGEETVVVRMLEGSFEAKTST